MRVSPPTWRRVRNVSAGESADMPESQKVIANDFFDMAECQKVSAAEFDHMSRCRKLSATEFDHMSRCRKLSASQYWGAAGGGGVFWCDVRDATRTCARVGDSGCEARRVARGSGRLVDGVSEDRRGGWARRRRTGAGRGARRGAAGWVEHQGVAVSAESEVDAGSARRRARCGRQRGAQWMGAEMTLAGAFVTALYSCGPTTAIRG